MLGSEIDVSIKIARINDEFRRRISTTDILFFPDMVAQGTMFSMQIIEKLRKNDFSDISPDNKTDAGHALHHRGEIIMKRSKMSVIWTIFNLDQNQNVLEDNAFDVFRKKIALLTSQEL